MTYKEAEAQVVKLFYTPDKFTGDYIVLDMVSKKNLQEIAALIKRAYQRGRFETEQKYEKKIKKLKEKKK